MHPYFDTLHYALKTKSIMISADDKHSKKVLNELIQILHDTKVTFELEHNRYTLGFDVTLGSTILFVYDYSPTHTTHIQTILTTKSIENYIEYYRLFNTSLYEYLCQIGGKVGYNQSRVL